MATLKKQVRTNGVVNNQKKNAMEKKFSEVQISVNGEAPRKAAFAFFNRDVNFKNVDLIFEKMQSKGYRKGEPIQVLNAEIAIEQGLQEIRDINKIIIPVNQYNNYYLVSDGQHRAIASSLYNDWRRSKGEEPIIIPAIEIDLIDNETIAEYISEINCTKNDWDIADFVKGAACVHPDQPLLQKYNELIKSDSNPKGYSISTLNLIYCNGKGFKQKDLELLCSGKLTQGNAQKNIIPASNIEAGNRFIKICKAKKIKETEIRKRYLIVEFNNLRNSEGGVGFAFKVLNSITQNDIQSMTNENNKMSEELIIKQFRFIKDRVEQKSITPSTQEDTDK